MEHPRPLLRRGWTSLDGRWAFALDPEARWRRPEDVAFDSEIEVPFAPETEASGIGVTDLFSACWYRRTFVAPEGARVALRFGAVDREATVWIDGREVGRHDGGYTPFSVELPGDGAEHELHLRAHDDPLDLEKPRGKQDWLVEPHEIWYPRTTGIWQPVWLEVLPSTYVEGVRWRASIVDWALDLEAHLGGARSSALSLEVALSVQGELLMRDIFAARGEVRRRIGLPDPGIDDARRHLLWSPDSPTLIDAELTLRDPEGAVVDRASSYTAMRTVRVDSDGFLVNERPLPLRLILDQGYWPGSGLTAPDVEAFHRDIELVQALGYNGVRKHQKVEDPRFLRAADERGLLVWSEMPSPYRFSPRAARRMVREWLEVLERDVSHPCVIAWVPFNESWGVPDLPRSAEQRELVRALHHLTRALDPDRPVIGNDGWEVVAGDFLGVHDYEQDPTGLATNLAEPAERMRPAGRRLLLEGDHRGERPLLLTEFGGIALAEEDDATWGYGRARDASDLLDRYRGLLAAVHAVRGLAGFCYTQLTDTYQEANGLLRADRTPKAPIDALSSATRGEKA